MRCKPGDLAYVVGSDWEQNIGALVNVCDGLGCEPGEWRCHAISPVVGEDWINHRRLTVHPGDEIFVADSDLRPIRDPGDDAVDETLLWAGSPALAEFLRATSPL